jgi:hypothetical protein
VTDLVYVYGILPSSPKVDIAGIDARRVRIIPAGSLFAAVSDVPEGEFAEEPLNAGMSDMHWLAPRAMAHQDVNQALHDASDALIPLAFGAVFRNDVRVEQMLSEQAAELRARLERVRGKAEWVVAAHRTGQPGPTDHLKKLQSEIDNATPGRAHLLKRRYVELERDETRSQEAEAVEHILAGLRQAADEVFVEPLPSDAVERPLLRASALVPKPDEVRFVHTIEALQTEWYEVRLTGPWPAYRFGGLEHAAAAR